MVDRITAADALAAAAIDVLTGALRRDVGTVALEVAAIRAMGAGERFSIAFLDVVGLKATNDRLGHAAGDDVLRRTADTIRECLRSTDILVRFGGDEFVCGLADSRIEDAGRRVAQVHTRLAELGGIQVSVGMAELSPAETICDVIARADDQMYSRRISTRPSLPATLRMGVGTPVEIRVRFNGTWRAGFEIAVVLPGGYRVRRTVDSVLFPEPTGEADVRRVPSP